MVMMNIPKTFTTHETAAFLGITTKALDNLAFRGRISYIKRGGKRLFRESDISEYIAHDIERPAFGRREK